MTDPNIKCFKTLPIILKKCLAEIEIQCTHLEPGGGRGGLVGVNAIVTVLMWYDLIS